ncbi:MAG TPA: DNA-formamidopyrimidine glycosylase family protein [Chryseosolibacter sp.]
MEGPSLVILKEQIKEFKGKTVAEASGLSKLDYERMVGQKIKSFRSWGKHFLIEFKGFSLRIHFLMFGSYRINERKETEPRLRLTFTDGSELNFYTTAVIEIDIPLDDVYEWSADVMSDAWDARRARKKLKSQPDTNVSDALLDQDIFAGVGNIIKNEVLFRIKVHPDSIVGKLPPRKLTELIDEARNYSFDFYHWKKLYQLKKHWKIYTKKKCPRCNLKAFKEYTGKTQRRTFFCNNCQVLHD